MLLKKLEGTDKKSKKNVKRMNYQLFEDPIQRIDYTPYTKLLQRITSIQLENIVDLGQAKQLPIEQVFTTGNDSVDQLFQHLLDQASGEHY